MEHDLSYWLQNGTQTRTEDVTAFVDKIREEINEIEEPIKVIDGVMTLFNQLAYQSANDDSNFFKVINSERPNKDYVYGSFGKTLSERLNDGFIWKEKEDLIHIPGNAAALYLITAFRQIGFPARTHLMFSQGEDFRGSGGFFSLYHPTFVDEKWSFDGWAVFSNVMKHQFSESGNKYIQKLQNDGIVDDESNIKQGMNPTKENNLVGIKNYLNNYSPCFFLPNQFVKENNLKNILPVENFLPFPNKHIIGKDHFQYGIDTNKSFYELEKEVAKIISPIFNEILHILDF
jgi:hypothetical protein